MNNWPTFILETPHQLYCFKNQQKYWSYFETKTLCPFKNTSKYLQFFNSLPLYRTASLPGAKLPRSHLEKILILQKRAVRLINFLPFRTHAIPYFAQSNVLPITMLYFKLSSILMFDITTNSAPQNIYNLFTSTQDIHQYNTRSASSGNYYINHSRLNHHKNSFSIVGLKSGTAFPKAIEDYQSTYSKIKFKHYYL